MNERYEELSKYATLSAHNIIETAHFTYNAPRGIAIVKKCIEILKKEIGEKDLYKKQNDSRTKSFGTSLANGIIKIPGLQNEPEKKNLFIRICIAILEQRIKEIQPKPADPDYLEARYRNGKKPR